MSCDARWENVITVLASQLLTCTILLSVCVSVFGLVFLK